MNFSEVRRLATNPTILFGRGAPLRDGPAAVTYAAEALATRLGIVDQLPCVVFFDPIETESCTIVKLKSDSMDQFMLLLHPGPRLHGRNARSCDRLFDGYTRAIRHGML
jgi:hypothetical protein